MMKLNYLLFTYLPVYCLGVQYIDGQALRISDHYSTIGVAQ